MPQNITAKLRYLRVPPRKARAVADTIRGLPLREAEAQLMISPRRPAVHLLKLLRSALANAVHNKKIEADKLYVKEIKVDEGPRFKRWTPRARGAISMIQKKTSHLTIILEVSDKLPPPKFVIKEKPKKEKKKTKQEAKKETKGKEPKKVIQEIKPVAKEGIFKRIFRRKTI
jgi:large subunit ribosomal protein L22